MVGRFGWAALLAVWGCQAPVQPVDNDGDGWFSRSDCNDSNPAIHPGMTEQPGDGLDNDCNPSTRDDDLDQDGVMPPVDCEPLNPFVPASFEVPYDGLDNDCSTFTPDDDLDGDGFVLLDDCDDEDPSINPGTAEIPYDLVDNDCDPQTADDDLDGDGLSDAEDCNDLDPTFNNPVFWYVDCDGDGYPGVQPSSAWAIPGGVLGCDPPAQSPCPSDTVGAWTLLEPRHEPDDASNTSTDCNDRNEDAYPLQQASFTYAGGPPLHPYDFDCNGEEEPDHGTYQCVGIGGTDMCAVREGYDVLFLTCGIEANYIDSCTFDAPSNSCSPTMLVPQDIACH